MILLVRPDGAGGIGAQLPCRDTAFGAGQLSGGEGFADQGADASLVGWFGSEKYSQRDGFSVWKGSNVVRRERARAWVVPVPAERNRYCAAECVRTAVGLHCDNRVVSIGLASHRR
jgi:hypothetical protein